MIPLAHRSRSVLHHRIGDLESKSWTLLEPVNLHHRIGDLEMRPLD